MALDLLFKCHGFRGRPSNSKVKSSQECSSWLITVVKISKIRYITNDSVTKVGDSILDIRLVFISRLQRRMATKSPLI